MTRRPWLLLATLLILPVLALGYGRLGGMSRGHAPLPDVFPESGLIQKDQDREDDLFACPVCTAEGRSAEHRRGDSRSQVHEGRRYQLCSGGCLRQFKKNPAYFLAALAERLRSPENRTSPQEEM